MQFKIVLVGDLESRMCQLLALFFDDLPYTLVSYDLARVSPEKLARDVKKTGADLVIFAPIIDHTLTPSPSIYSFLVEVCNKQRIPIIAISSYCAFGLERGISNELPIHESGKFTEFDGQINLNLSAYEDAIKAVDQHIILRMSWLIDEINMGLLDQIMPCLLDSQNTCVAAESNFGNPIYTRSIAEALIAITHQVLCGAENWGIFHFRGSDRCSEAEFVDYLTRILVADFDIQPANVEVAGVDDTRGLMPGWAYLEGRKCTDNFGVQFISWRNGLKAAVKQYLDEKK